MLRADMQIRERCRTQRNSLVNFTEADLRGSRSRTSASRAFSGNYRKDSSWEREPIEPVIDKLPEVIRRELGL
jgi:hypothetical protein